MNNIRIAWVADMERRIQRYNVDEESQSWTRQCIYRLPENLFRGNPIQRYTPQMVSLGPYHHGRGHLQQAERHKERALIHMIRRSGGGGGGAQPNVGRFWLSLSRSEKELRDHYDQNIELPSAEFLQTMLLDGCFMLEIMRAYRNMMQSSTDASDYSAKDPIFSREGMFYTVPIIRRDMLLIENQIPLLALEKLMEVERENPQRNGNRELIELVVFFFKVPGRYGSDYPKTDGSRHVLDIFRKMQLQDPCTVVMGQAVHRSRSRCDAATQLHPTATQLREAGVKFKNAGSHGFLGLRFERKRGFPGLFESGELSLPLMVIDDFTEEMLLNLMAFERMDVGLGNEVSSYVHFVDRLIDSAKDVELLEKKGILQNMLGSDEEVATLFNRLCRGVAVDGKGFTVAVQSELVEYSRRRRNRWLANLHHNYLNSPWAIISLIGAFILLILTLLQTIYTVKSALSG